MASVSSIKKRASGKLSKRCLTLDEKIKIVDQNNKRKMSCREIADQFNIGKIQTANILGNEARLRADYESFQGKGHKHVKK